MASRRQQAEKGTEITLPITPMLDMSFQLLFFFISTFKLPTNPEGTLDLSMPSQATPMANDMAKVDPSKSSSDEKPDLKNYIIIKVENPNRDAPLDEDVGSVTPVYKGGKEEDNQTISTDWRKDNYEMKELADRLHSFLTSAETSKTTITGVEIQGAPELKFKAVVRVMDVCRKAGLKDIHFGIVREDFDKYSRKHLGKD
ncbi:MAG TPA: biopolymer transporter ExbD [Gemmataceae bacterium]|nr:biopolymer transporter ExbD [Gemmataceae bacterium]